MTYAIHNGDCRDVLRTTHRLNPTPPSSPPS